MLQEAPELRKMLPIIGVTDCKSVYDTVHRDGFLKLPTEKRLNLDVAALKDMIHKEIAQKDPTALHAVPLCWVPTEHMLADCLTKAMDGTDLRTAISTGCLRIAEGEAGVRPVNCHEDQSSPPATCAVADSLPDYLKHVAEMLLDRHSKGGPCSKEREASVKAEVSPSVEHGAE